MADNGKTINTENVVPTKDVGTAPENTDEVAKAIDGVAGNSESSNGSKKTGLVDKIKGTFGIGTPKDMAKNAASAFLGVGSSAGTVVMKGVRKLGGFMGVSSGLVSVVMTVLSSTVVTAFVFGTTQNNAVVGSNANCNTSYDSLSYNLPYVSPIQEERDGWARSIWRILGSKEITRDWASPDATGNAPSGYVGDTDKSIPDGSGMKYYMRADGTVMDKDIDNEGNLMDSSGTFERGFSIEAAIGVISCADTEGGVRANGYEGVMMVGPEDQNEQSYTKEDIVLSNSHHYDWDAYVEALASSYEKSDDPIQKDAAENMRDENGPYSYTDRWTGEKHKYPGIGLVGFTGAHGYELQEFCDTFATPWEMNGDNHNDAMFTLSGQLLFMIYEDDWFKFVTSSSYHPSEITNSGMGRADGKFYLLELPNVSLGECAVKNHPKLSGGNLTIDERALSMYLRAQQIERWDNDKHVNLQSFSCYKEFEELCKVRAKWEKEQVENAITKMPCTFVEWGVFNTIRYDYNIWCYYPSDLEMCDGIRLGGGATGSASSGGWQSKGKDEYGNDIWEETVTYSYNGARLLSSDACGGKAVGRIDVTTLTEGCPVYIDFDSGAYMDAKLEEYEFKRRLVNYKEGYMHEHGPEEWYNKRTPNHYRMSVWLWDIRHEVIARDRFGRILHRMTKGDEVDGFDMKTLTELKSNLGEITSKCWEPRGAYATKTNSISSGSVLDIEVTGLQQLGSGGDGFGVQPYVIQEIKQGQWLIAESRCWKEQEFKVWYNEWYGADIDSGSDEGDFKDDFVDEANDLWNNTYHVCGSCANCPKCKYSENPECSCGACKCDVHHIASCPLDRSDRWGGGPCDGCPIEEVEVSPGVIEQRCGTSHSNPCVWVGGSPCSCPSHLQSRWAEAVHEVRLAAQKSAVKSAYKRATPAKIKQIEELNKKLFYDVWIDKTSDDHVCIGGLACETLAAQFYYSFCMGGSETQKLGHDYGNNNQAAVHFTMCSHYWEQYMGTLGRQLSDRESTLRASTKSNGSDSEAATKLAAIREHALLKHISNRYLEDKSWFVVAWFDDGSKTNVRESLTNYPYTFVYGSDSMPAEQSGYLLTCDKHSDNVVFVIDRAYTDTNTLTDNPKMFIMRRKWYANDELAEFTLNIWDRYEAYDSGSGASVQRISYHSNYRIRDYMYKETGTPRCGPRLDLTNITSTALSLAWPQGHSELATINNTSIEPGAAETDDRDFAAKLCTEAYVKVKDLVFDLDEHFYSSCDRGVMTVARASGADPLFYWTSPTLQMAYMQSSDLWYDVLNDYVVSSVARNPASLDKDVQEIVKSGDPQEWLKLVDNSASTSATIQAVTDLYKLQPGDILVKPASSDDEDAATHIMIFVGSRCIDYGEPYWDWDFVRAMYPGLYKSFLKMGKTEDRTMIETVALWVYCFSLVHSSNANENDLKDYNGEGYAFARGLMLELVGSDAIADDGTVDLGKMLEFILNKYKGYHVFRCINQDYDSCGPKWSVNAHWVELANSGQGILKDDEYSKFLASIAATREAMGTNSSGS